MSRSNPHEGSPNPAVRWFEWSGSKGLVRYYDKENKANVTAAEPFTFMLLDQLGKVGGWHDSSDSGIYSNEVKDIRQELLVVKSFKGGVLAEGLYKDIKDRVNAQGGHYVANLYIAFKLDGALKIGSLRFKGAALSAWMEFVKANRSEVYKNAIQITGFTEGKKGSVVFRVPTFKLLALSSASNDAAVALDRELQDWLKGYFARSTGDRADHAPSAPIEDYTPPELEREYATAGAITDDDIPFAWMLPLLMPALALLGTVAA